jgi:hypothetical protein
MESLRFSMLVESMPLAGALARGVAVCLTFASSYAALLDMHTDSPSPSLQIPPKSLAQNERYVSGIFDRD